MMESEGNPTAILLRSLALEAAGKAGLPQHLLPLRGTDTGSGSHMPEGPARAGSSGQANPRRAQPLPRAAWVHGSRDSGRF